MAVTDKDLMVADNADLDAKIVELTDYVNSDAIHTLAYEDSSLLWRQLAAMQTYQGILEKRIERSE